MAQLNDGGPAFPHPSLWGMAADGEKYKVGELVRGMSLRDYFAAHPPPMADWFLVERFRWPTITPSLDERGRPSSLNTCVRLRFEALSWEEKKEAYLAWPYAYADFQLAQREKYKTDQTND